MGLKRSIAFGWGLLCMVNWQGEASAKAAYGMAGCGLGSVFFGSSGGQLSAATTNASSFNQAFGITSGTSNCQTTAQMAATMKQEEFLAANLSSFQKELAQGEGQTIEAFVELLGCKKDIEDQASRALVEGYDAIFRSPGVRGILSSAKEQLGQDQALATHCQNLG